MDAYDQTPWFGQSQPVQPDDLAEQMIEEGRQAAYDANRRSIAVEHLSKDEYLGLDNIKPHIDAPTTYIYKITPF